MSENTIHVSPNAWKKHRTSFVVAAIAAVFMTITGALGTGQAPLTTRFAFWIIVMESGALIAMGVEVGVQAWGLLKPFPWAQGGVIAFGIALPLTLIVAAMRSIMFDLPMITSGQLVIMFGYVFFVSLIMVAIGILASRMQGVSGIIPDDDAQNTQDAPVLPEPDTEIENRFCERLPIPLKSAVIYAVQSEDHYLRVYTEMGEAMILHRLSDAIAELSQFEGRQVHRSWWVAKDAIQSVKKAEGKTELVLVNGLVVPISRSTVPQLRKEGWL